jgi:hypothetical protein
VLGQQRQADGEDRHEDAGQPTGHWGEHQAEQHAGGCRGRQRHRQLDDRQQRRADEGTEAEERRDTEVHDARGAGED